MRMIPIANSFLSLFTSVLFLFVLCFVRVNCVVIDGYWIDLKEVFFEEPLPIGYLFDNKAVFNED